MCTPLDYSFHTPSSSTHEIASRTEIDKSTKLES